jgi:CelD/BcsL family acetyltransferase involved in cellulose biosynthesis
LLDFTLKLPKTWDELRAGLSRNMKEALRKCANALPRDGHDHKVDVISAPDEIRPALRQLIRLHALRAAADGGVLHPNVFAAQAARGFITEIVHELARRGEVRIFSLSVSGQPVAMRLGFVCASDLYLYYSGYDPAWGRYSVMTTVVAEAIKWAIQQGFDRVNLSTGSDPSKLRWRPEQLELLEGTQSSAKLRSQFALAAMELARASSA